MKKEFKTESKKLLNLMINSIYSNKEIFLREIISNASDAIDKLSYAALTDENINIDKDNLKIKIEFNEANKTITVTDNGCGMTKDELEVNLGTIAKSDSQTFKEENKDVNIIGQFGVGFYSAFMVAKKVSVLTKSYKEDNAYLWESDGVDGYTINNSKKDDIGTQIVIELKDDTEEEKYSEFLDEYKLKGIIKKYSDYIKYPITMDVTKTKPKEDNEEETVEYTEEETINSMIPVWKKDKKDVSEEEYNSFYMSKFNDYEKPLKVINTKVEGKCSYNGLIYIPSHVPYDYYTKDYEKGLELYASGVLIMDKCKDLVPDYFSFVKGLIDTDDLSLNISREILQQDSRLKLISNSVEKKIKKELETMLNEDRDNYVTFFKNFGMQIKAGIYANYGMNKDLLQDLIIFYSNTEEKMVTLKEYVSRMKEGQEKIYYATGETIDKIDMLPQVELVKDKGYEILYLTEYADEFVFNMMMNYNGKEFINVSSENLDLTTEEEKKELENSNQENKQMFDDMTKFIDVKEIKFTNRLKNHPVCLTTEGVLSTGMEKILNQMPNNENVKATTILEININHPIANKLKDLYKNDKDTLEKYTKILYNEARLIEGLPTENPTEISNLICDLLSK
jgi:molecular chaperone HtpG